MKPLRAQARVAAFLPRSTCPGSAAYIAMSPNALHLVALSSLDAADDLRCQGDGPRESACGKGVVARLGVTPRPFRGRLLVLPSHPQAATKWSGAVKRSPHRMKLWPARREVAADGGRERLRASFQPQAL
jgi:hypothetical protein